jgi:F0F1-type ATP synthase membrane subunit b/b'
MSKGKFGKGLVFGAVAGALGVFLSRKENRDKVKQGAKDLKTKASSAAKEAGTKSQEAIEQAKKEAETLKKRSANAVQGAKEGFNKKV